MKLIRHHLAGLLRFSGRDSRSTFWPWVGIMWAFMTVATMIVFVPEFIKTFAATQQFAEDHPDQATVTQTATSYEVQIHGYHPELMPDFVYLLGGMGVIVAICVALLAASVTRRLHDTGRRGFWGLMPLPFLAFGLIGMSQLFQSILVGPQTDLPAYIGLFAMVFVSNLAYLAALITLAIMLARRGEAGPNSFGEDPQP